MTVAVGPYGAFVSPADVEDALKATLEIWLDGCLGEIERHAGYPGNSIERPRGIVTTSDFEKWPEDQIPVVLILNAGLAGRPMRRGDSSWEAAWHVGVAPVVSDVDAAATRLLAFSYATAIRLALLQHKALKSEAHPDGFASFLTWEDEIYSDLPFLETRSLGAARIVFRVGVANAVTEQAGPRVPPPVESPPDPAIPPQEWPDVIDIDIKAAPVAVSEAV